MTATTRLPKPPDFLRRGLWCALLAMSGCAANPDSQEIPGTGLEIFSMGIVSTGKGPVAMQLADLNHDMVPDVLVVNGLDNTLSVYLQQAGSGIPSTASAIYPTGRSPSAVVAADLDGDMWPEVLVTNLGDDSISTYKNLKMMDGTLSVDRVYTNIPTPIAIAADDLNGDMKADVVVSSGGESPLGVLLNDGAGMLSASAQVAIGKYPYGVALGAFSVGARPDLVATSAGDDAVKLFVNDGSGGFAGQKIDLKSTGRTPTAVITEYLSSTKGKDILVANYSSDSITVLSNKGSYGFDARSYPSGRHPSSLATGLIYLQRGPFNDFAAVTEDGVELWIASDSSNFYQALDRSATNTLLLSATVPSAVALLTTSEGGQRVLLTDREKNQMLVYEIGVPTRP